jgi:hypothetical protein
VLHATCRQPAAEATATAPLCARVVRVAVGVVGGVDVNVGVGVCLLLFAGRWGLQPMGRAECLCGGG